MVRRLVPGARVALAHGQMPTERLEKTIVDFAAGEYEQMLATLAVLRGPVDSFFDNVMVNAEDPALRATRQALLKRLYDVMNKVAEIARLAK